MPFRGCDWRAAAALAILATDKIVSEYKWHYGMI